MERAEDDLHAQVCQGDKNAFEVFCLGIEKPLFGYVRQAVKDSDDAKELVQEVLLRVYRMARSGELTQRRGSPRALAFSIAHNLAVDHLRHHANVTRFDHGDHVTPHVSAVERALLREQLDKALADLPENHRSAIALRAFGQLSYAEIAEALGATPASVKTWILRARRRLAELLDRDGQYLGEGHHEMR
ncbi:MAG TPA: RNA polymerase sigma factor [Candidatus Hydrogenedentes bacterium]|nr:RNA polymerase sigma factor [Candidatus Hydrogenedentota bacterium]HOZ49308.1 RNA polymerase sigma factor [Candidatus Hydrogenedentota bacterium]HPG69661.1 RNA polymerase sigma factor [Candidatus Hydrogenedentota bacterium]